MGASLFTDVSARDRRWTFSENAYRDGVLASFLRRWPTILLWQMIEVGCSRNVFYYGPCYQDLPWMRPEGVEKVGEGVSQRELRPAVEHL
jgi:hypothetical protein